MDETRHNLNAEIPISSTMSMDDAEMPSPSSIPIDLSTTTPSSTSTTSSTINISQQQPPSMDILNSLNSFPHMSQPSTSHQLPAFPQLNELLYSTLLQSGQQQVLGERLVNSCFDGELSQMLQSAITSTAPLLQQQQPQQPNIADSVFWEHWMCLLATNLSPQQWQAYWQNYASMFGLNSLPLHLFSFFNNPNDPTNILLQNSTANIQQQQIYRTESQQLIDHERCKFYSVFIVHRPGNYFLRT